VDEDAWNEAAEAVDSVNEAVLGVLIGGLREEIEREHAAARLEAIAPVGDQIAAAAGPQNESATVSDATDMPLAQQAPAELFCPTAPQKPAAEATVTPVPSSTTYSSSSGATAAVSAPLAPTAAADTEAPDVWAALGDAEAMCLCLRDALARGYVAIAACLLRLTVVEAKEAQSHAGVKGDTTKTSRRNGRYGPPLSTLHNSLHGDGDTAMHVAARHDQPDCLAYLAAKGVSLDVRNMAGQTPLIIAALSGSLRALQWLLVHGAAVDLEDRDGYNALSYPILAHHHACTFALMHNGVQLDAVDAHGNKPFLLAAVAADVALCAELSVQGANVHHLNHYGENALGVAVRYAVVHDARLGAAHAGESEGRAWAPCLTRRSIARWWSGCC